ncbi:MAG: hypothetical protein K0S32_1341 [Bacteroidetes bacterium]|nr:hypothetical protein [Bacteroidota bacterium]
MKRKFYFIAATFSLVFPSFSQKSSPSYYLDNPTMLDSASTIIIPTRYNSDFLSTNKIASWGDYYSNIIFYNFVNDSYKKLFEKDTYIAGFNSHYYSKYDMSNQKKNSTAKLFFLRVKNVDHNQSGRIDSYDPTLLYICDHLGNNLKSLTTANENVLSIEIYEKQNFALVKLQRDYDKDGDYENEDKDFYYVKLDLNTLTFGTKIEIK